MAAYYPNHAPVGNPNPRTPVYQIDFSAVASGKVIASTKRRVRWKFGFANAAAIEQGLTGTECRGEEHDVTLVWSIASGKRLVLADGHEVHYSCNRSTSFEFSWTMKGNHVLKVVAHASPPLSQTDKMQFRQYDFYIDGQSFFSMPKMFALNTKHVHGAPPPGQEYPQRAIGGYGGGGGYNNSYNSGYDNARPRSSAEEERDIQRAIQASLAEAQQHGVSRGGATKDDLEDLLNFDDPTPVPMAQPPTTMNAAPSNAAPPTYGGYGNYAPQQAASAPSFATAPYVQQPQQQPPQQHPGFAQPPTPMNSAAPTNYNFAQQPAPTPVNAAPAQGQFSSNASYASSRASAPPTAPAPAQQNFSMNNAPVGPTGNPFENASSADQAYNKFVNTDFFASNNQKASNPFDSSSGPQPTLGSMQSNKSTQAKQPVMNTQSASLVPHQQQNGNFGGYGQGPPHLQQPVYNGVGNIPSPVNAGYGFAPQQQPNPYGQQQGYAQYGQQGQPRQSWQ